MDEVFNGSSYQGLIGSLKFEEEYVDRRNEKDVIASGCVSQLANGET